MANFLSSASEPDSSLQPPDGGTVKAEERLRMETEGIPVGLAKRFLELQAQNDRIKEENQSLGARNLVLEEMFRQHRQIFEDKDEQIIRLKEDAMSMSGTEGRLNEKYDRLNVKYRELREELETEQRKRKEEAKKSQEKYWLLEVEKRKMEIDLQAARKGEDGSGDVVGKMKAVVEELKRLMEEKDLAISELVRKNKILEKEKKIIEKEKMEVEEKLNGRVIKLEQAVATWLGGNSEKSTSAVARMNFNVQGKGMKDFQNSGMCSDAGVAGSVKGKGTRDLQNSGPKSVGTSLIQLKEEIIEADVQIKGHERKEFGSMVSGIRKEVTYAPKSTDSIVQISDDEKEEEKEKGKEEGKEEKHIPPVPFPPTATWPRKRKFEALTCSAETEKQAETRFCESNGTQEVKLWETAEKMHIALNNSELCLKSICALYRKHNFLGVWKNHSSEIKAPLGKRGMYLGKLFTGGDPEGRVNKEAVDLKRVDEETIWECRYIVRLHVKELFEIYNNNMDPLFQP